MDHQAIMSLPSTWRPNKWTSNTPKLANWM